jgi:hypothetical protein
MPEPRWIESPCLKGDAQERSGREEDGATPQKHSPCPYAPAQLVIGFFGSKAVFDMKMRRDVRRIRYCPFYGAPIVSHQKIGPEVSQHPAEPRQVPERAPRDDRDLKNFKIQVSGQTLAALIAAVHRDEPMPERPTERVGEASEPDL